ncbi:MAG: TonB-dependent receptor [Hyphomonadaceae bacterium]|nr:TonB-dependent receptor [Hyphomonadaceae bacterium]
MAGSALRARGLAGAVLAGVAWGPLVFDAAQAQEVARAAGQDEIIVTARRVAENLQDAPLSVTVVSARDLDDAQIRSTVDLDAVTPSLQFAPVAPLSGNNAAAQVFIRGIGQTDPTAGVDPGVGIYVDDVYMGSAVGGVMDFRDIASVQVLRGPQGTLFGRNTIGGAILLQSAPPGETFGGSIRIGAGTDALREGQVALDAPLSSALRTRWTFGARRQDGYVRRAVDDDDLGDADTYTVTGKAVYQPSRTLSLALRGDLTVSDENGAPLVFAAINTRAAFAAYSSVLAGCPGAAAPASPSPGAPTIPAIDDARCANNFYNDGPFVANGTFDTASTLENWGVSGVATWAIADALTLKSITAYRSLLWTGRRDADNTPFPILHTDYKSTGRQFSQELQLTYARDPLTVVSGLYYLDAETQDRLRVTLSPPGSPPGGTFDRNDNQITNTAFAAYGHATYTPIRNLAASLGLRYTEETKGTLPSQFNEANPANAYVLRRRFESTFESTTASAALSYRLSDAVFGYASLAQGFKSGGFNSRFNAPVPADPATGAAALTPPSFDPETAESVEVGVKLDPTARVRVNLAAFTTRYDDVQLTYRFGVAPYIFNAGRATIRGVEAEVDVRPTRSLSFDANVSYLDDRFDAVEAVRFGGAAPTSVPVTLASRLAYVPEWQGSVAAELDSTLPGDFALTTRADVVFTGAQFFDTGNTVEIAQTKDVTTLNLAASLEPPSGRWRLRIAGKNVTDEIFPVAGNSSLTTGSGYAEIAYNRGREVVVSIAADF